MTKAHKFPPQAPVLQDILPNNLGMKTPTRYSGGIISIIEKGTVLPCRATQTVTTQSDHQSALTIQVFEGLKYGHLLGNFNLTGIRPAPRGALEFKVCFDVDVNGILRVSATDKSTIKSKIAITSHKGCASPEALQTMINNAKKLQVEDDVKQGKISAGNQLGWKYMSCSHCQELGQQQAPSFLDAQE